VNQNVGNSDRMIRIAAGVVLLSLTFLLDGGARWIGLIGVVPLFTGLTRWCPAYSWFGINTCERKAT